MKQLNFTVISVLPKRDKEHSNPFSPAIIIVGLLMVFYLPVAAQCDTFYNADAANLIKRVYPYSQSEITGVAFTDIDNDGDLDCYFAEYSLAVKFIENHGNAKHPQLYESANRDLYSLPTPVETFGAYLSDMEFADIDGDGDQDFFTSQYVYPRGASPYTSLINFENSGTPSLPNYASSFANNPIPAEVYDSLPFSNGAFTFYDIDKDDDLDFAYSTRNGTVRLFLNSGCKTKPSYTYYSTIYPVTGGGKPQFYDWDSDGLPDLIVNGKLYLNTGTLTAPAFAVNTNNAPVFTNGAPFILTDVNNDGALEAYTYDGHLSTVATVPAIDTTVEKIGNRSFAKYYSAGASLPGNIYNWVYNGKLVPGYHKPFIYALKKGAYSLEITNHCGTGVSLPHLTYDSRYYSPGFFTTHTLPAVQLQRADFFAKAYPNPFRNEIQVQMPPATANIKRMVIITDVAGRRVETVTTNSSSLRMGGKLPAGMYILQVVQNGDVLYHLPIMKQ